MKFISDYFIASDIQTDYLGKNADADVLANTNTNTKLPTLLSYDNFNTSYLPSGTTIGANIYYKTSSSGSLNTTLPADGVDILEFNMSLAIPTTHTKTTNLLALLNDIRVTYNLLDDVAIKRYIARDNTLRVNKYTLDTTILNKVTYEKTPDSNANDPIANITNIKAHAVKIIPEIDFIDSSSSNLLVIRRVLLGYESMIHCYIALYTTNENPNLSVLTNRKFDKMNSDLLDRATGIGKLQSALKDRVNIYNAQIKKIGTIDKDLVQFREKVEAESDEAVSNEGYLKKNMLMCLIIMLIFIVCAISLTGVLIVQQDKNASATTVSKQKIIVGTVFIVSAISTIVVYFVNKMTNVEKFTVNNESAYTAIINSFNTYLEHTINIALLVDNYKRYGDITNAAKKEAYFYDGVNSQLKLRKETLTDKQTQEYRSAKVVQYRVYMLLQILLAVSIFVFIGLYTGPNSVVLTFMIITVLIIVYMYMITTHNLVFTDATKLYWGHPTPEMLN